MSEEDGKTTSFFDQISKIIGKIQWNMEQNLKSFRKKKIDSDLVFYDKYLKTEVESYNNGVATNFDNVNNINNKVPKDVCQQYLLILFSNRVRFIFHRYF